MGTRQQTLKPQEEIIYNASECKNCNDDWIPFSIGMQYRILSFKNKDMKPIQIGPHDKTVFCAISFDTDRKRRRHMPINRINIRTNLAYNEIFNTPLNPEMYFHALPNYKFVISPEGNGIDCHRHYEALMAGAIPIVEENPLIQEKYKGCPILYTKDYSEINREYLEQVYTEMIDKTYDFSPLLFSAQPPEYQAQIRINGNYWGGRLVNGSWYD